MKAWTMHLGLGGLTGLWRRWPRALLSVVQRSRAQGGEAVPAPVEPEFVLATADLVSRHALADVEARAVVHDPLGAAPREPFGHLFMRWRAFKRRAPQGAELWSFEAVWDAGWGSMRRQAGYAWVKDQAVVGFVVIESRPMRREELMPPRLGALAVKP